MTKGKFPNNLAAIMSRMGIGATELARRIGDKKQNVSRHMRGERQLTGKWANKYAPHLGVHPQDLMIFDAPKSSKPRAGRTRITEVPLLSWVAAGRLISQETVTPSNVRKVLTVADLPSGDWIALEVQGDSMNLIAPEGSIILINRRDERLIDGRYYVFATEYGESTFKRYKAKPVRLQPYSTNPDHETYYPSEELRLIGRVRRVVTDI